jgi:hypothetical protein
MKFHSIRRSFPAILLGLLTVKSSGDPVPQPQTHISNVVNGSFNVDWEGVAGRTYFMQFSLNLMDWHYAPFIHFGDGPHVRGVHSDTDKFFLRLRCEDIPGIDSLDEAMNADFDGDGISNIFEVTHGYNPFDADSTVGGADAVLDPDNDGLGNASEQLQGTNPMSKDHSLLKLEVIEN